MSDSVANAMDPHSPPRRRFRGNDNLCVHTECVLRAATDRGEGVKPRKGRMTDSEEGRTPRNGDR